MILAVEKSGHCLGAIPSQHPTLLLTVSTNGGSGYAGRGRDVVGGGLLGNEGHD